MDISSDIDLIYNTLQSGNLDQAFVLHNKLLEIPDLTYEDRSAIDLVYARLLLEMGEYEKTHDILMNLCEDKNKLKSETLRLAIDVYYVMAMAFTGRIDEAKRKISEIENLLPKIKKINFNNSNSLLSELHNVKGIIAFRNGNHDLAVSEYEESLQLSRKINFRKDEARTLFNLGGLYAQTGELNNAISFYMHSLEIFEGIRYYEGIMPCLTRLKEIHQRLNDDDAVYMYDRKILDFSVFMDLRRCKIASSRMDLELNSQIVTLIEERNKLEQTVWELEFTMNSMKDGIETIPSEMDNNAREENEALKERLERYGRDHEVVLIELDNVKKERDRLLEDLQDTSDADGLKDKVIELELKANKAGKLNTSLETENNALKQKMEELQKNLSTLKEQETARDDDKLENINKLLVEKEEEHAKIIEQIKNFHSDEINAFSAKHDLAINQINNSRRTEQGKLRDEITKLEHRLSEKDERSKPLHNEGSPSPLIIQDLELRNQELKDEIKRINIKLMESEMEMKTLRENWEKEAKLAEVTPVDSQTEDKIKQLELANQELKENIKISEKIGIDFIDLKNKFKLISNEYDDLKLEFEQYKNTYSAESKQMIIDKDKEITRLQVKLANILDKESEPEKEVDTEPVITQISSPSSRIVTKVEPIRQTIRPSEVLRLQNTRPGIDADSKHGIAVQKIGQVYHESLSVNNESLDEYLQSDRLAESLFQTITEMKSIQLKFLATRHGVSSSKVLDIVEDLKKIGVIDIVYEQGNEVNPNISIKLG